jgi:ribose transport system ATP-binding protein
MMQAERLSKSFNGQRVLDSVSLSVGAGEVHALLGHNGSGKSTFIKVLAGFHHPDPGSGPVTVDGVVVRPGDPDSARRAGLRFIHQELGLVDNLTVLENLRLGTSTYDVGPAWRIRWSRERRSATALLERIGLDVPPDAVLRNLSPIQRTGIAIARAVQDEDAARVIVFDEPTAALPNVEVARLFELIRRVTATGVAVLYVTHRLEEVYEIGHRVTVLRDGVVVGSGSTVDFPRARLVSLIVGSEREREQAATAVSDVVPPPAAGGDAARGEVRLSLDGVTGGELNDTTLEVRAGEVLGVAGLAGSGVHDLPNLLLGLTPLQQGTVKVGSNVLRHPTPSRSLDLGLAVLPSARWLKALPTMSVRENITLATLGTFWHGGIFHQRQEKAFATALLHRYGIKPPDPERRLATFSGGNQQKVSVARLLQQRPSVLVLDEPTQGVDVGGSQEIIGLLRDAARSGLGVMFCSSDLNDLAHACDRVLVLRSGRVAAELTGAAITRERIVEECYGNEPAHV